MGYAEAFQIVLGIVQDVLEASTPTNAEDARRLFKQKDALTTFEQYVAEYIFDQVERQQR